MAARPSKSGEPAEEEAAGGDLAAAAMWGDKELLESLLRGGADPDFPNLQGNSALHEAAYYGELECASILLDHKANVNIIGAEGKTPLHKAIVGVSMLEPGGKFDSEDHIKDNQCDIIKVLVSHGAQLSAQDNSGSTPQDLANDNDFYEAVDLLQELKIIIEKEAQKRERKERLKALYAACETGEMESVKEYLQTMPEAVNEFICDGKNLLMCAAEKGYLELVEYLLDNRAIAVASPVTNKTALHLACHQGNTDIVIALLNRLPALLAIDDSPDETSLHIAAREGHVEIVRNLLAVAARAEQLKSLERSDSGSGRSEVLVPLYGSGTERVQRNLDLLDSLGEVTVDIMAPSASDRRTPLHEAAMAGHVEVVQLILNFMRDCYPASASSSSSERPEGKGAGLTPRHDVSGTPTKSGQSSPRLGGGSSGKRPRPVPGVDQMTMRGRTALHEAAKNGHFQVMSALLAAGADINAFMRPSLDTSINVDLTALVQACLMNRPDIVRFLLQNGATDSRLKALSRSLRQSYNEVAGLLLCYNGGAVPVVEEVEPSSGSDPERAKVGRISVSWNSKKLAYIHEDWLQTVCMEVLVYGNRTPVIAQLDISSNELRDIPLEVFQLKHLTRLDLSRNKIERLPVDPSGCGWGCGRLSELDVSSNQLSSLPAPLFLLPQLKELNANDNNVGEVDVSLWSAPKLTKLFLSRNSLREFLLPETTPSPLAQIAPTRGGYQESGYQSGVPMSASSSLLISSPSSNGRKKSLTESSLEESLSVFRNRRRTSRPSLTFGREQRRMSLTSTQSSVISWRFKNFQDTNFAVDEVEDLESEGSEVGGEGGTLEHLDLSRNLLTSVPSGLSCLAPKLQKLNLSHNRIRSLGKVCDYPPSLEMLDASNNELCAAITESPLSSSLVPCARKFLATPGSLVESMASPTSSLRPCSHRLHRNLQKLSTIRLSRNQLVDLQLFRLVSRTRVGELTGSTEEGSSHEPLRKLPSNDPFAVKVSPGLPAKREGLSKSVSSPHGQELGGVARGVLAKRVGSGDSVRPPRLGGGGGHSSNSSNSGGSVDESSPVSPSHTILSPIFPMLSTLELAHNSLYSVPANIHLVSTLACLILSHNPIESLPLELSYLEHLWNLEYDGCNIISPPRQDLDKYRLAADKLLYMRSLLHDAKPNESLKLMLVGLQKMGKTTLLSRLTQVNEASSAASTFNERVRGEERGRQQQGGSGRGRKKGEILSTVGVDLGIWKYRKDMEPDQKGKKKTTKPMKAVTFYTWDFGGQEEYYVTHQCFLSTRSLYLVVWDVEEGEEGIDQLGLWLHNIQARAPDAPVVIVGTHLDKLKGEDRERQRIELSNIIKDKYLVGRGPQQQRELGLPKIRDVAYVACPPSGREEGVAELRRALYDIAFSLTLPKVAGATGTKMKLLEQPIPASFLQLEERVRLLAADLKRQAEPPLMKEARFREETSDVIANPRELDQAVTFLHENGVMLHYATPALSHLYFVDPQWLCDMLAHVVTVPEVNSFIPRKDGPDAGILRTSVLAHVFKGKHFPQEHRQEYTELLGKFEVALILDRHRLLVPSLLPLRPPHTIHAFHNVFPRPSIHSVLSRFPNISNLFSDSGNEGAPVISRKSPPSSTPPTRSGVAGLAAASHISEELFRTGLLLRRFYFMTYVPSGFWPRLISRFLTCSSFVGVVLRALGHSEEDVGAKVGQVTTGETNRALGLEWTYWKTGIELWYKGMSLLRVTEILSDGVFDDCEPSPSIFEQSRTVPIKPADDVRDLSFELNGQWMPVDLTPNHGIEILVPDTVCPAVIKSEMEETVGAGGGCERERVWMSAGLLTQAVDFIDTLLEDWYPGLGAREGNTTIDSVPYVNRVIPCPFCVSGACVFDPADDRAGRECSPPCPDPERRSLSPPQPPQGAKFSPGATPPEPPSFFISSDARGCSPDFSNLDFAPAKRHRFRAVNISGSIRPSSSPQSDHTPRDTPPRDESGGRSLEVRGRSLSSPQTHLRDVATQPIRSRDNRSHEDLMEYANEHTPAEEKGLVLASRFGFMIESCIMAARSGEDMICPSHRKHPLPIRDIAPDVVFADLPTQFLLDNACVDRGLYVDHGTFGDIYHGTVYPTPTSTDDEGREVALKIDRLDSKKCTPETATKSYIEVRAEVSLLHRLRHPHVIDFMGVVLQPLCFILEWACGGSLHSALTKYRKMDARIGPQTLQQAALQVASGLSYLHKQKVVYYDLKSPNVLVFQFPSPQQSMQLASHQLSPEDVPPIYLKIADLGISRIMSPGGTMGFKGSPGFMAPEILKYVGTEAVTEKVDIYSFGMFMYELISLYFPFEKQNLMSSQIEKLVIEGERPPLQNRELSNPILYLDIMRWCWQQDFRSRPSASQLIDVLSSEGVPSLMEAISLHGSSDITSCALCIFPIEQSPSEEQEYPMMSLSSPSTSHQFVARGDLQEDIWLGLFSGDGRKERERERGREGGRGGAVEREGESQVCVINFKGKASFSTQMFPISSARITAMCCVVDTMWVGTEEGELFIFDSLTKNEMLSRLLALLPGQAITNITHLTSLRQVLVTRSDGCVLLFDEVTQEHKLPDDSRYDNRLNGTQLPVRSVFRTPEKLPVFTTEVVGGKTQEVTVWCGSSYEMALLIDVRPTGLGYCRKCHCRPRNDITCEDRVADLSRMEREGEEEVMWALTDPGNCLYCWSVVRETLIMRVECSIYSPSSVTAICSVGDRLHLAQTSGEILQLHTPHQSVLSVSHLRGHVKSIHSLLTLGARVLPRHWRPSILGRSNVMDHLRELLGDEDIRDINDSMVGTQTRLLVSVGKGFYGIAGKVVETLMSPSDISDNFLLLWSL